MQHFCEFFYTIVTSKYKFCSAANYMFLLDIFQFQHMNSPKHHVKAAEGQKSTEKLKEIPMLNMFLKTLQPPSNYFPNQEKEGEESSSNTEVER